MAALHVGQSPVSNTVHGPIGRPLVNVQLYAMVHNLDIKLCKDLIVIEMTLKVKVDHVVQQQKVIKKVVRLANASIQHENSALLIVLLQMKHVLKLKIHYLLMLIHCRRMVHVVVRALKLPVSFLHMYWKKILIVLFLLEPEICSVNQLPADYIRIDNCTSTEKISQQQCLGGCISYSMSGFYAPQNICRCCAPTQTSAIQIEMKCTDSNGDTIIMSKLYENIVACGCSACETKMNVK